MVGAVFGAKAPQDAVAVIGVHDTPNTAWRNARKRLNNFSMGGRKVIMGEGGVGMATEVATVQKQVTSCAVARHHVLLRRHGKGIELSVPQAS